MPVLKLPIVHKFGIISHSQRLQLQSRLIGDLRLSKSVVARNAVVKNPFEITESFVQEYNAILNNGESPSRERARMTEKCNQMFLKIQRRVGLQFDCEGQAHINVALGWSELAIISQCQGPLSEKALDLLHLSLSVAPFSGSTLAVQFFLLETALYFLQTMPFAPASPDQHIKWLQIGELASLRIYIQCRANRDCCRSEHVDSVRVYARDLRKCHSNFQSYAEEAAISLCVIEELVKFLTEGSDANLSADSMVQSSQPDRSSLLSQCLRLWHCVCYPSHRAHLQQAVRAVEHCLTESASFGNW